MKTLLATLILLFTSAVSPVFGEEEKYKVGSCKLPLREMESEQFEKLENLDKSELVACLEHVVEEMNLLSIVLGAERKIGVRKNTQIKLLGSRLNSALARVASEQRRADEMEQFISNSQSKLACLTAVENGKKVLEGRSDKGDKQLVFVHKGQSAVFQLGSENSCRFMQLK